MKQFLSLLILLVIISCSSSPVAHGGTGTGVGNGFTITGVVASSTGEVVPYAEVELIPEQYITADRSEFVEPIMVTADSLGVFSITHSYSGVFNLWTKELDQEAVEKVVCDTLVNRLIELDTIVVAESNNHFVEFSPLVLSKAQVALVQLYGGRYSKEVLTNTVLNIPLPAGDHVVKISFPGSSIETVDSVLLVASDTINITDPNAAVIPDSFVSRTLEDDYLVLRSILALNGQSVGTGTSLTLVTHDNDDDDMGEASRITGLRLHNIDTLPPYIAGIIVLESLTVSNGNLKSVPAVLGELEFLKKLVLCNNNIDSLPDEITRLENIVTLDLRGNPLRSLSSKVKAWIADILD